MGGSSRGRDRRSLTGGDCSGVRLVALIVGLNRIVHGQVHDRQIELGRRAGSELNRRPSRCNNGRGTDVPVGDHVGRGWRGNGECGPQDECGSP